MCHCLGRSRCKTGWRGHGHLPHGLTDCYSSSRMMISVVPGRVSPVMELVEELNTHVSSIHTDEEPNNDDVSASDIVISVDVASAATESSNRDSAASCSGVNNVPAACLNAETSHSAVVSADEVTTGMNDTVSAGDEFLESTAGLADDNASGDEAFSKSERGELNDAAAGTADGNEAAEPSTTSVMTVLYDVASADEGTDNTSSICEDTSSRKSQRVFNWIFRVLFCCCFSLEVEG